MSSTISLSSILDETKCDIALINEHKLLPHSLTFLESIHKEYKGVEIADRDLQIYEQSHCGKSGVGIMYKKTLEQNIKVIDCKSDRIIALKLNRLMALPLFIFCVYLPADNDIDNYRDYLESLDNLITYYKDFGYIIVAGDMNASIIDKYHVNRRKSQMLMSFARDFNLEAANIKYNTETDIYAYIPCETTLDYFLVDRVVDRKILSSKRIGEENILTVSDQLPIFINILTDNNNAQIHAAPSPKWVSWHKVSRDELDDYTSYLEMGIEYLSDLPLDTAEQINAFCNSLNYILTASAKASIETSGYNPRTKPYWTTEVKAAHTEAQKSPCAIAQRSIISKLYSL
jgi:hypothetical protein